MLLAKIFRWLLIFTMMVNSVACYNKMPDKLQLAVSANMQYAMAEITKSFEEAEGVPCEIIVGSSGKLTAQILGGAPFDVFLSADMKYPKLLHEQGFAAGPPSVYAYGKLVLWTNTEGFVPSLEALQSNELRHLAVASPELAPYGEAAMQVLERLGKKEALQGKMVFGESISQTSQFISTGAAELGFTAKSVVMSPEVRGLGHWVEVESELYQPIAQGLIILKGPDNSLKLAESFKRFLLSEKGKKVLELYGYQAETMR